MDLKQLEAAIKALPAKHITTILKAVEKRESQIEGSLVFEERANAIEHCPRCGHQSVKWGTRNGVPRFKCKNSAVEVDGSRVCGKTFTALTGTPLARLHNKDKLIVNARCMIEGKSVRKTAAELGLSKATAFRWRHIFLHHFKSYQPAQLSGLVEADETFFLESFKGKRGGAAALGRKPKKRGTPAKKRGLSAEQIPVLVARERTAGLTLSTVITDRTAKSIGKPLLPRLAKDAELFTDGASAYYTLAKNNNIELRVVPRSKKHLTSGALHINNVNAYDQRLKGWMDRFKGVATYYLENYLAWHRWLDRNPKDGAKSFLATSLCDCGT